MMCISILLYTYYLYLYIENPKSWYTLIWKLGYRSPVDWSYSRDSVVFRVQILQTLFSPEKHLPTSPSEFLRQSLSARKYSVHDLYLLAIWMYTNYYDVIAIIVSFLNEGWSLSLHGFQRLAKLECRIIIKIL